MDLLSILFSYVYFSISTQFRALEMKEELSLQAKMEMAVRQICKDMCNMQDGWKEWRWR